MDTPIAGTRFSTLAAPLRLPRRHPLPAFVLLAFAGSWLVELPLVLGQSGLALVPIDPPALPFLLLMPFTGPTLAALLVGAASEEGGGLRDLRRQLLAWRQPAGWYALAIVGPPLLLLLGAAAVTGPAALRALAARPALLLTDYLLPLPLILALGGPLGEEPGWRGFALPRMQRRYGPLAGTLLLGALHALWHLPLFLVRGAYAPLTLSGLLFFASGLMLNGIIWTWAYNRTQASLPIVILLHAAVNASGGLVQPLLPPTAYQDWIPIIGYGAAALALVIGTQGRLGMLPPQESAIERGKG